MGVLLSAFGLVFLAELGDKTQLVALGFGARHRVWQVALGLVLGFGAVNVVSVGIGGVLGAALPTRAIGIAGGLVFLGFAVWTLRGGDDDDDDAAPSGDVRGVSRVVVVSIATAIFLAELGDKTMLATATLAAKENPALVWVGATLGESASAGIGALVGRSVGRRLPERAIRYGSAGLFAVFGIGLLVTSLW